MVAGRVQNETSQAKLQGLAPNVASQALLALLAAVGMGSAVLSGLHECARERERERERA